MQDRATAEALVAEYQKNAAADGVDATPTFLINGKKEGNMSYEEFAGEARRGARGLSRPRGGAGPSP